MVFHYINKSKINRIRTNLDKDFEFLDFQNNDCDSENESEFDFFKRKENQKIILKDEGKMFHSEFFETQYLELQNKALTCIEQPSVKTSQDQK